MSAAPLLLGVALCVLGGVIRMRAWHAAVALTNAEVRYRDVVVAHLGGAGFNGVVPAHGGDAVKLALLKRRAPDAAFGQLLGSLAPPAAVEALVTAFLLAWALTTERLGAPSPGQIPLPLVGAAAAVAAGVLWLLARRAPRLLRDVRSGMAALRRPAELAKSIAPWVLVARFVRLGALACFLAAVGLPFTIAGVLVVMAIQGGVGSSGPASAPVRIAVLAASLPAALAGHAVSVQTATTLLAVTQVGPMVANLAISVIVLGVTLRTVSPRRVLAFVTRP
ncbi:MAG TPA: hypothetical protein VH247_13865 [Thermoleophilaceae bacterium]|nr:hypothetical protein [Thermoleophilaceae bacterium]